MPIKTDHVKLGQEICFISRRAVEDTDNYTNCFEKSHVRAIIANTAIFHSTYYAEAGMSSCSVVAARSGESFALVGVHVASHDKTISVEAKTKGPAKKKQKKHGKQAEASSPVTEEFDDALMTVNSNIHGHGMGCNQGRGKRIHAYCSICEVSRVEGLLELLK